jgi:hypothetical protein
LQQKHIAVVAYCSYCREDRGRHTHRGSHSSSHDSRRRDLSDAKINTWKKSPILGERAQRHSSRGSDGHRGSMSDISSTLHQSDIPCSKGERLFRGRSKAFRQGEHPQGEFRQGEQPQGENYPFPLMSKGER